MDVQRYISSGIIENHVVGLLPEQEAREVEAVMEQYPEIKAAVESVRQDMEQYVLLYAKRPPKAIKQRLMASLDAVEPEDENVAENEEGQEQQIDDTPARQPVPLIRIWQYVAVAAIVLLLASSIVSIVYFSRFNSLQDQYAALEVTKNELQTEKDAFQEKLQLAQKESDLMKDPEFKWIKMQAVGKHTGAVATICWNPRSKETYILAQALPEAPEDKQYQLWAIVNGKPIDAGVFELGNLAKTMQKVKDVINVQVFAVTLEEKGGSVTPSLDQMFVAGKVAG